MLDEIDTKIVCALQRNGRISNFDLAAAVGLSPSPCLRRVRHLESVGVITDYVALVSSEAVGLPVTAYVQVRLASQADRNLADFEQAVATFPEVMECYLMTGDSDYQIRVQVESLAAFEHFLRHKLTCMPAVAGGKFQFCAARDRLSNCIACGGARSLKGNPCRQE